MGTNWVIIGPCNPYTRWLFELVLFLCGDEFEDELVLTPEQEEQLRESFEEHEQMQEEDEKNRPEPTEEELAIQYEEYLCMLREMEEKDRRRVMKLMSLLQPQDLLSVKEVAKMIGWKETSIRTEISRGKFPIPSSVFRRHRYFLKADVLRYLMGRENETTTPVVGDLIKLNHSRVSRKTPMIEVACFAAKDEGTAAF